MLTNSSPPIAVKPSAADIELTLGEIRGVFASSVLLDRNRDVSEIHIVASTARRPKQIVRDVETFVYVKHGVKVDYRKISLVQIPDENLLRVPLARPEIRAVTEEAQGNQKRLRVEIQGASRIAVGEAYERMDNPTHDAAAKATIEAIEKLLDHKIDVRLDEAETIRLGQREVMLVILTCLIEDREETLVGASFVGPRPAESTARATLDALNRRIHLLNFQVPHQT